MRILFMLIVLAVAGCGGSGSDTPPVRPAGKFVGVAHDAPLINADIKIYDWSSGSRGSLLAETTTDYNGDYNIELTSQDKPILIVAGDSGSYVEEASGRSINLEYGQNITAVTNYESGETVNLQITPFTHLAQCYARYLIDNGTAVQDALNLANSKIAGIAGVDIIGTRPLDVTDINNTNIALTPGLKYGFLTAGISELMLDVAEANGLPAHSQSFLTSIQWSKIACNDVSADGLLDGHGYIDNDTTGQLAFGTYPITANTYRTLLAQRMLTFSMSENNKTGLVIDKLLVFASALSTNTDSIWGGEPGQPVDSVGPVIVATVSENSYIGGESHIPFEVSDPVGVLTVKFYVDDALVATHGTADPTLIVNTRNYLDGSHEIKVVAVDAIGNESELLISYYISNAGPAINMTSPTVVGSVSYTASGTWVSSGATLTSITVDGVAATISPDGTWEANIALASGLNSFGVIAIDELTNNTTHSYAVGVDLNAPAITEKTLSFLQTTYQGLYNLCNPESFVTQSTAPLCIRTDKVSLDGTAIEYILGGLDYVYLNFDVVDTVGAGVYSEFEELTVEYMYEKNSEVVMDWTPLATGFEDSNPSTINGYYILPITTEYLGDDWFNTSTTDTHVVTIRLQDSVGNLTTKSYTMQFDVMLYGAAPTSSSNASSMLLVPFESRATVFGSTVTSKAIVSNTGSIPFYLKTNTATDNSGATQVYDSLIRKNRMAVKAQETWRVKATNDPYNVNTAPWSTVSQVEAFENNTWIPKYPVNSTSAYTYVFQDVVPNTPPVGWSNNTDYPCEYGLGDRSVGSYAVEGGGYVRWITYDNYRFGSNFACVTWFEGFANPPLPEQFASVSYFQRYINYTHLYENTYPRNFASETTLTHSISGSVLAVFNATTETLISDNLGVYTVPPGDTVEVRKTVTLPELPFNNDIDVAVPETFSSYTSKHLDKQITWTIDETIDLSLYAAVGASQANYSINKINDFIIARN
ncbi:MAG: hypothetical protein GY820_35480 [Gammaproteobacteria bacterium]|nr:hypothetical protein [Gammaproteobacteria bacterium]